MNSGQQFKNSRTSAGQPAYQRTYGNPGTTGKYDQTQGISLATY